MTRCVGAKEVAIIPDGSLHFPQCRYLAEMRLA
jgi:hypothetical protein